MKIIDDFLSSVFIDKIINENKELLYSNVWRSSLGWQKEIIGSCGTVLIRDLSDEDKNLLKPYTDNIRDHCKPYNIRMMGGEVKIFEMP